MALESTSTLDRAFAVMTLT